MYVLFLLVSLRMSDKSIFPASFQHQTDVSKTYENLNCSFRLNFDPSCRKCLKRLLKGERTGKKLPSPMRRKSVGDEELLHELRKKGGNIARVCVRVRIYGLFMAASADLIIQY
jgi:hypothetical protein